MGLTASALHREGRESASAGGGGGGGGSDNNRGGPGATSGSSGLTSGAASGGDIIRRCNCYSMSLDRKCYRHSLTFSAQTGNGGGGGRGSNGGSPSNDKSGNHHSRYINYLLSLNLPNIGPNATILVVVASMTLGTPGPNKNKSIIQLSMKTDMCDK